MEEELYELGRLLVFVLVEHFGELIEEICLDGLVLKLHDGENIHRLRAWCHSHVRLMPTSFVEGPLEEILDEAILCRLFDQLGLSCAPLA